MVDTKEMKIKLILKTSLIAIFIFTSQSCISTTNFGVINASISKPNISNGTRTKELSLGVVLSPIYLVCDILFLPIEVISYSDHRGAHSMTWNFKNAYIDGWHSVEEDEKSSCK